MRWVEVSETRIDERHQDIVDALLPYSDRDDIFIHYTDIEKLGIFPESVHSTPLGVYGYPLNWMIGDVAMSNIPYASERKFVLVFQSFGNVPDASEKDAKGYSTDMWAKDRQTIKEKYFAQYQKYASEHSQSNSNIMLHKRADAAKTIQSLITNDWNASPEFKRRSELHSWNAIYGYWTTGSMPEEKELSHDVLTTILTIVNDLKSHVRTADDDRFEFARDMQKWERDSKTQTPAGHLWNVTRELAICLHEISDTKGQKAPYIWTSILRKLGYDGFSDVHSTGLIHHNEPRQAVFFNPQKIKLIKLFPNVRKSPISFTPIKLKLLSDLTEIITFMVSRQNRLGKTDKVEQGRIQRVAKNITELLNTGRCHGAEVINPKTFIDSINSDISKFFNVTNNNTLHDNYRFRTDVLSWAADHLDEFSADIKQTFLYAMFGYNLDKTFRSDVLSTIALRPEIIDLITTTKDRYDKLWIVSIVDSISVMGFFESSIIQEKYREILDKISKQ